jgi:hyperosmotically inducible periplasmic protein
MRALLAIVFPAAVLLSASGCAILRAHEGPTAYVGDSTINARVEIALIQSPKVEAREIDVHTYQGVVTLEGVVDTAAMARLAGQITRDTPGVRTVNNLLQVAGASRP